MPLSLSVSSEVEVQSELNNAVGVERRAADRGKSSPVCVAMGP